MDKNKSTDIHTLENFSKAAALSLHLFAGIIMIS